MQLGNRDYWSTACHWVQNNEALWRSWIAPPSMCLRGQGLWSFTMESFVQERSAAWLESNPPGALETNDAAAMGLTVGSCRTCLPGTFSQQITDDFGKTAVCQPCAAGSVESSPGSAECDPCVPGSYNAAEGSPVCQFCEAWWQCSVPG
eukprot:Skav213986  [mRNA]  locus=scaffold2843:18618:19478:+ [translate_table: standard]